MANEAPEDPPPAPSAMDKVLKPSVYLAILVFLLNMIGAWAVAGRSTQVIGRPLVMDGQRTAVAEAIGLAGSDNQKTHVFINRLLDADTQARVIQSRQSVVVVAMSAAFALIAIGFALFVMGAEGAFKVQGQVADRGALVVKATAPGILCFVLATCVICFALLGDMRVDTGEFKPGDPPAPTAKAGVKLPPGPRLPEIDVRDGGLPGPARPEGPRGP